MTEWLDVVDAQDRVTGKETRARVHEAKLFHRSSHVVLANSDGHVFVQLRSPMKDTNADLWDTSAAGHVDSGESYLECAQRELVEELGVLVESGEFGLIGRLQPQAINGFEFTHVFSVVSDQPVTLQQEEIADGRWLAPDALEHWISNEPARFTDVFKMIWKIYRSR